MADGVGNPGTIESNAVLPLGIAGLPIGIVYTMVASNLRSVPGCRTQAALPLVIGLTTVTVQALGGIQQLSLPRSL